MSIPLHIQAYIVESYWNGVLIKRAYTSLDSAKNALLRAVSKADSFPEPRIYETEAVIMIPEDQ